MPPTPVSASRNSDELFINPADPPPPYSSTRRGVSPTPGSRPTVQPKPQALQGRPRTINGTVRTTSDDSLAERFSQLRVPRNQIPNPPVVEIHSDRREGLTGTPSPSEHAKPMGPRSMGPPSNQPRPPPKIPLSVPDDSSLPRAPSPAYDPSRAITSPASPSNNSRRAQVFAPSPQHNGTSRPPSFNNPYMQINYPQDPNGTQRSTESLPAISGEYRHPTAISTDRLYESLRESNVLVIDVRSRAEFDQGHIWAKSIICIEPVSLRHGLAAEELEESLVVSPPPEIELFAKRNDFDYVVYYDQQTPSDSFLTGPPNRSSSPALRALHDTLREFNYDKPLRRPPLMLRGGLDAWADLVGTAGLAQSKTAALIGSTHPRGPAAKVGRPLGRVRMASQNSSLEVRKRRMREHKPLNEDEEESWLERARNEEVQPAEYQHTQSDNESEEPTSPFVRSYEEFLHKFPEVPPLQQSMTVPLPPPPSRPPPPPVPTIPSRPPPAAPRPSYSGVSDRNSSQISPTSRLPSSAQPPLYTSRTVPHYLKLRRTGLINFGVTCYMNATVQCLLATIPLSQFFLDNRWRDFTQKNWKGSNGVMPGIYANLIRSLWKGDVAAVRPVTLRRLCARLNPEWGLDRQQDAKEYLDFLLDCLHEDLNQNWERQPLLALSASQEATRERMPVADVSKIEWQRYSHRESSFISNLFAGQHASRLRCTTCHNTSTTYEAFYSIS
ncbi:MAG: hypothetical protein Q9183_002105, partial [Haloplaca sp. 2 TL-2023]